MTTERARDARDGKFVTAEEAAARPDTTVIETVPDGPLRLDDEDAFDVFVADADEAWYILCTAEHVPVTLFADADGDWHAVRIRDEDDPPEAPLAIDVDMTAAETYPVLVLYPAVSR